MRKLIFGGVVLFALAGQARAEATPTEVVKQFYDAFVKCDTATMERLYSPDVKWQDTIFSFKDRSGTMGMWRILLDPNAGSKFTYEVQSAKGDTVVVRWLADYKFLGNPVHNDVVATLVVKDGKIVKHDDVYSWEKWARQAFPWAGPTSNWWGVRHIFMGGLNAFLRASIFFQGPSKTPGVGGALDKVRVK